MITKNDGISALSDQPVTTAPAIGLRDYFAGCVAVGIMRTCDEIHGTVIPRDNIAMEAYRMADAMLKAREGK